MERHSMLLIRSENLAWGGLRQELEEMRDIRIVGDVRDAATGLRLAAELAPQVIVTGAAVRGSLPPLGLLMALRQQSPRSRIVLMADEPGEISPRELLTIQGLGVDCHLAWNEVDPGRFHRCVLTAVEDGYVVASRRVAITFIEALRQEGELRLSELSVRERQILNLLVCGTTDEEVAHQLGISYATVQNHVHDMMLKLHARTRLHLGAIAAGHTGSANAAGGGSTTYTT